MVNEIIERIVEGLRECPLEGDVLLELVSSVYLNGGLIIEEGRALNGRDLSAYVVELFGETFHRSGMPAHMSLRVKEYIHASLQGRLGEIREFF